MDNKLQNSFADQLRVEGVNCKGFGIIPKYIMLDTELTLEAKSIYAYFCSFSGNGNSAFPTRDKILADLQISKDTYYKHYQLLIDHGYITVKQNIKQGIFANNIYTLVSNPKKVQLSLELDLKKWSKVEFERLRVSGIKAWGYGMIPKAVMIDPRLPLKSKGIYAYFASFSGSGGYAFPTKEKIQYHLGLSEPTYYKFYSLLTKFNYITAVQRHIDGRKQVNDYYLNDMPDEDIVAKNTGLKNLGHGKAEKNTGLKNLGHGEAEENTGLKDLGHGEAEENTGLKDLGHGDMEIQDLNFSDTEKQDTEISDTNKNNIKSNNIKNNTPSFYRSERAVKEDVIRELLARKELPYEYTLDCDRMTEAIHFLTDWECMYPSGYSDELKQKVYNLFNEALIQLCMTKSIVLKGSHVTYAQVIRKINQVIKFGENYADISDVLEVAMDNYYAAAISTEIKNPLKYMESCIWDALLTGNVCMYSSLKKEFGI